MAWTIINPLAGMQAITETSTVQKHPLGLEVEAYDPTYGSGVFVYALGVASTVARDWVVINADDWSTARLGANSRGPVGIAMSANVASQYGWYQRVGKAFGTVLTGFTDDGRVYASGTAGAADDASIAGDAIVGAKGASAVLNTGSTPLYAEFEIDRPRADHRVSVEGA